MSFVKLIHVLCIFIWIGSLMTLTRFLGYHVKENADTQMRLAKIYHRIYKLVQFPTMILAIIMGVFLLTKLDLSYKPGWFHMKITFALGLVACDFLTGRYIKSLCKAPDLTKGIKYKMLHGITGLLLIGVLVGSLVIRDKKGEILYQAQNSEKSLEKNA